MVIILRIESWSNTFTHGPRQHGMLLVEHPKVVSSRNICECNRSLAPKNNRSLIPQGFKQEIIGLVQDGQAEITRRMEHVAMPTENFCRLKWDKAYFLNPEEYFSSVVSGRSVKQVLYISRELREEPSVQSCLWCLFCNLGVRCKFHRFQKPFYQELSILTSCGRK